MSEYIDLDNAAYRMIARNNIIKPKFKIELLDAMENIIGEITKELTTSNAGSISVNYQQGVRRSCSFTIEDTYGKYSKDIERGAIFGFNSKFKLYVGLENLSNGDVYWFSQGVYYTINPTFAHANSNKCISVQGVDKFGIFTSDTGYNQMEGTYIIPAGSRLYDIVKDVLTWDIGNGTVIDPREPILDNAFLDYVAPYEIKKSPGGYVGDLLIEIANVLGADIFYDAQGRLTITKGTTDMYYSNLNALWDFTDVLPEYSNSSVALNTVDAINSVRILGTYIDSDTIYIGTAENTNPLSPTSIDKIGKKMYYEESSGVYSQQTADEYARYVLRLKSIIQTAIQFSCTILPHLDVNKIISITDSFYGYDRERFIIQSLNFPLTSAGIISVSCNNIASLPYYDLRSGG